MIKIRIKYLVGIFLVLSSAFLAYGAWSPYDAARHGDLDTLRQYRFDGIDLFVPDERGFIPYELAALHADPNKKGVLSRHVEVMLWLKEYQPQKHRYGKASIALVQAGLSTLGYAVVAPDGAIGEKTISAIKAYQKNNGFSQTGRLGPQWLGTFYQDILEEMQFKLTKLGFDTQGTDGMMGENTRQAMLKYRRIHKLSQPYYRYLDALLLSSIDKAYQLDEKHKKVTIAKNVRVVKEKKIRFVQAGLRTLGYRMGRVDGLFGSKTVNAIKKFQKKYKLSVTGKIDDKTQAKMDTIFLKETQRKLAYLGYKVGELNGKMEVDTAKALSQYRQKYRLSGKQFSADLIVAIDDSFDKRINELTKVKISKKLKPIAKKKSKKANVKKSTQVIASKTKPPMAKRKKTSSKRNVKITIRKSVAVSSNSAKGRMVFKRRSGRVVGCSIAGLGIPIEWCEPFYPLPNNNHCEATLKPSSGKVLNLWCK
ncbi:MAG: peptidoglycan-binding domain-containing protein [Ostreibacterium sp.]